MKCVLVTGGSGGIGAAVAETFAKKGYSVAVHYRRNERAAREAVEKILGLGGTGAMFQAELTDEEEVERLFARVEDELGAPEVLVNNAGMAWKGLLTDMTVEDWRNVTDTNLTSAFLCCRRALPAMIRRKSGCIINISSMWGQAGASCEAAYSAAKAGLIGLTKALAKEEGPSGIRVNCVAPGIIQTPMNEDLSGEELRAFLEEQPLMRIGLPEEVAEAVLFLAENEFVTGQVLGVNGGFVI